jgi:hypothetical protein
MAQMELTPQAESKWNELENLSLEAVRTAVRRGGEMDNSEKAAVKALGIAAKNRQTCTARAALCFNMASAIASPDELQRYIQTTNPVIHKALQKGGKEAKGKQIDVIG